MKILVIGATGFVGHALTLRLLRDGHQVIATSRHPAGARGRLGTDPDIIPTPSGPDEFARAVNGCHAVVMLGGAPLVGKRWSKARKQILRASRIDVTRDLSAGMTRCERPPRVLVSASAVGIYGNRNDEVLTEDSSLGDDFLATLCQDWEAAARSAESAGVRTVQVRLGPVVGREGGILAKLLPVARLGLGGRLGSGAQWVSWIHLDDVIEIIIRAIDDERMSGPVNATAPNPVTNAELVRGVARTVGHSAHLPVPALALEAVLGTASRAVLDSQLVRPARLIDAEFHFHFDTLEAALSDTCRPDSSLTFRPVGDPHTLPPSPYLHDHGARHELTQETVIQAPVSEVFPFFAAAENLGAITPPTMAFAIQTPGPIAMKRGQLIDYRIRLGPFPMRWRTRIENWERGSRFVDTQVRGPYQSWWHEHRFVADGERTIMIDRVLYSVPLGIVGRIVNRLVVQPALERVFSFRSAAIRRRLGLAPEQLARAA